MTGTGDAKEENYEMHYDEELMEYVGSFWRCEACKAQNSVEDGECQFCECGGLECKRSSCSAPEHFPEVRPACGCGNRPAEWVSIDETRREYLCAECKSGARDE